PRDGHRRGPRGRDRRAVGSAHHPRRPPGEHPRRRDPAPRPGRLRTRHAARRLSRRRLPPRHGTGRGAPRAGSRHRGRSCSPGAPRGRADAVRSSLTLAGRRRERPLEWPSSPQPSAAAGPVAASVAPRRHHPGGPPVDPPPGAPDELRDPAADRRRPPRRRRPHLRPVLAPALPPRPRRRLHGHQRGRALRLRRPRRLRGRGRGGAGPVRRAVDHPPALRRARPARDRLLLRDARARPPGRARRRPAAAVAAVHGARGAHDGRDRPSLAAQRAPPPGDRGGPRHRRPGRAACLPRGAAGRPHPRGHREPPGPRQRHHHGGRPLPPREGDGPRHRRSEPVSDASAGIARPDGFSAAIATLHGIGLDGLEQRAALMTRTDRKYIVPAAVATALVAALSPDLHVLEIGGARDFAYRSLYYDTPELTAYRTAATKRRRRFKVRRREYVDAGTAFLEVKTRTGRGDTEKVREQTGTLHGAELPLPGGAPLEGPDLDYVLTQLAEAEVPPPPLPLRPVLETAYRRTTLLIGSEGSRVTLDSALTWRGSALQPYRLEDLFIVE